MYLVCTCTHLDVSHWALFYRISWSTAWCKHAGARCPAAAYKSGHWRPVKPIYITLHNLNSVVSGKMVAWRVLGIMPSLRKSATLEQTDTGRDHFFSEIILENEIWESPFSKKMFFWENNFIFSENGSGRFFSSELDHDWARQPPNMSRNIFFCRNIVTGRSLRFI